MKRTFFAVVIALCFVATVCAADVTLAWDDPNPTSVGVSKYQMYQATQLSGPFNKIADIAAPTRQYTITGLTPGVYYFRVTASNVWEESGPSNVLVTPSGDVQPPTNLILVLTLAEDGSRILRFVDPDEIYMKVAVELPEQGSRWPSIRRRK